MAADDDPCMVSNVTESILPLIPERAGGGGGGPSSAKNQGTQVRERRGGGFDNTFYLSCLKIKMIVCSGFDISDQNSLL